MGNSADAALAGQKGLPILLDTGTNRGNDPHPCDNDSFTSHTKDPLIKVCPYCLKL